MGGTIIPAICVRLHSTRKLDGTVVEFTSWAWNRKTMGDPTEANAAKLVADYVKSQYPGGPNYHPDAELIIPEGATIYRNDGTHAIIARWRMSMFWVLPRPDAEVAS